MKFLIIFVVLMNTFLSASSLSNFTVKKSCLNDIQAKKKNYKHNSYTSLVFEDSVEKARQIAKKNILKKINMQIASTSILYYKNEVTKENNTFSTEATYKNFQEKITSSSIDIDLNTLKTNEFYCHDEGDVYFLYTLDKGDVIQYANKKLKKMNEENEKLYKQIQKESNVLHQLLLYEKIVTNYLPYLMIIKSDNHTINEKYFKNIKKYQKAYALFLQNTRIYIDIEYPYNRVFPIEDSVDEVRQEIKKILSKHYMNVDNYNSILDYSEYRKSSDKQMAIIKIKLSQVEGFYYDKDSYDGYSSLDYPQLEISLYNELGDKKNNMQKLSSIFLNFEGARFYTHVNIKKEFLEYEQNHNILKLLANIPRVLYSDISVKNFTRKSNGIVIDTKNKLEWQDNIISPLLTWNEAQDYCKNLSLEGRGWRLPTKKELFTIVDKKEKNPAINKIFHNTVSYSYWTNSLKDGWWHINSYGFLRGISKIELDSIPKNNRFHVADYVSFAYRSYSYISDTREKYFARCVR